MQHTARFASLVALTLSLTACGGSVVFEEDGPSGEGGDGSGNGPTGNTSTASAGGNGGATTTSSNVASTSVTTTGVTVGPTVSSSQVGPTVTTGTGAGICGTGVSLFDGSADACLGNLCCDAFDQCTRGGQDVAGCQSCLDGNGGDCGQALDCARGSGCLSSGVECPSGLTTGDPSFDTCLAENCCFDAQFCTNGGQDVEACISCFEQGGGPRCQPLLGCIDQFGCQNGGQGICDSGLTTGDRSVDQCLANACCDPFSACTGQGTDVQTCIDCFNRGGGPLCDEAIACTDSSGCF